MGLYDRDYMQADYPGHRTASRPRNSRPAGQQAESKGKPGPQKRRHRPIWWLAALVLSMTGAAVGIRWLPDPPPWARTVIYSENQALKILGRSLRQAGDYLNSESDDKAPNQARRGK